MNVVYDATPLLMRSAGVKNYHHALLKELIPSFPPHRIRLFPFLKTLKPNRNERSNYPPIGTGVRLGGVLASNYSGLSLASLATRKAHLFHATQHVWQLPRGVCLTSQVHDPTPLTLPSCHTASTIRYFKNFVDNTLPQLAQIGKSPGGAEEFASHEDTLVAEARPRSRQPGKKRKQGRQPAGRVEPKPECAEISAPRIQQFRQAGDRPV